MSDSKISQLADGSPLATGDELVVVRGSGNSRITVPNGGYTGALAPVTAKTAPYSAAPGDLVPVDTTGGPVTITLPSAPADKTVISIKMIAGTSPVTIACGGADVLNKAGGSTSATLSLTNQAALLQYKAAGAIWYVVAVDLPLSQLDTRFQPLDSDLTTIAALNSGVAGVMATDGGGWIRKTWAQVKAKLGLALNATDYGVTFDGVTDDTAAWQALVNAAAASVFAGEIVGTPPAGFATSVISGPIIVPSGAFWKFTAPGLTLQQNSDNQPHFLVTNGNGGTYLRSSAGWVVEGPTRYTWANQQKTTVAVQGALSGTSTGTFDVASAGPFLPWTIAIGVNALNSGTVNVQDASRYPTSGSFVMGGVTTTYTGKSIGTGPGGSDQLTGCGNHAATVGGESMVATSTATITVLIDKELISGTITGTTFTISARGVIPTNGGAAATTPAAHSVGASVYAVVMTTACAIYIASDPAHVFYHNFVIEKVLFEKGSYLLGCAITAGTNVWGYTMRDVFLNNNVVGGCVSNIGTQGGQPNNRIEGVYVIANEMVGPIFDFNGGQSTWMTGIELNNSFLSPIIIRSGGGGEINIGTLKSEVGTYDNRNLGCLFQFANEEVHIDFLKLEGMVVDVTGMARPCIFTRLGATGSKNVEIRRLNLEGDYLGSVAGGDGVIRNGWTISNGNYFATDASSTSTQTTGLTIIGQIRGMIARNFYLTDKSSGGTPDATVYEDGMRGRVSPDRGDADYTWDPFGISAKCLLKLTSGSNPADGDTVVLSGYQSVNKTYRFKTTPAQAFDVKIGADFAATLGNLAAAINGTGTPGTEYFAGTQSLPQVVAGAVVGSGSSATLTLSAIPGGVGNAFVCTSTGSVLQWRDALDTANKTVFSGGALPENVICFETAFTADRIFTLPAQSTATQNNVFNGAWVTIIRTGGGNFDQIIKQGATEIARIYSGQTGSLTYRFRRNAWTLVEDDRTSAVPTTSTPGDPAGSASGTGVMMGLAGSFKPKKTGNVVVTICGDIFNTVASDGATAQIRYGTGAAPTNGAAPAGTAIGQITKFVNAGVAAERVPYSLTAAIAGLTPGTAYWFDIVLVRVTGGTATIENNAITVAEV